MTDANVPAGHGRVRGWLSSRLVLRSIGFAAIVSGSVVLVVVVLRYLGDISAASMNSSGRVWAIIGVALLAVAIGLAIHIITRWPPPWSRPEPTATPRWALLGGCGVGLVFLAPLALVSWYPVAQPATLAAYDIETGTVQWQLRTPATELFGIASTDGELKLFGRVDSACDFRFVTIDVDPANGQVLRTADTGDRDLPEPGVASDPEAASALAEAGLRWDATGRLISDHGWSVQADLAVVLSDVVYVADQGGDYLSECSY